MRSWISAARSYELLTLFDRQAQIRDGIIEPPSGEVPVGSEMQRACFESSRRQGTREGQAIRERTPSIGIVRLQRKDHVDERRCPVAIGNGSERREHRNRGLVVRACRGLLPFGDGDRCQQSGRACSMQFASQRLGQFTRAVPLCGRERVIVDLICGLRECQTRFRFGCSIAGRDGERHGRLEAWLRGGVLLGRRKAAALFEEI
jgi:hypothetical protein